MLPQRPFLKLTTSISTLSKEEKALFSLRLLSSLGAVVLIALSLIGPVVVKSFYITRVNCSHLEVSKGLYNSLKNSVGVSSSSLDIGGGDYVTMGSRLTSSDIQLLADYAEQQVGQAPQYCLTSLWRFCSGFYDTYLVNGTDGEEIIKQRNKRLTCITNKGIAFDYRTQLLSIGLQSILAYAYQTRLVKDPTYEKHITERENRFKLAINAMIFTLCAQVVLLLALVVIYSNRGPTKDLSRIPGIVLHVISVFSVMGFCSSIIESALITNLINLTTSEVKSKLGDFGVSFASGPAWMAFMWLSTACCTLAMASWALPMWCANPPDEYKHSLDDSLLINLDRHVD
ncbi:ECM7 [Candida theae]|uniref:ECM7 n=1 Tax=Candida theae TaxID=1198502 RepID=A0AAD5BIP0_9ASCO|nr:ECM7 [Candida theae]KAI5966605.1 ECM7 [Candida theae]